ncbi:GH3 auxin-responsive promoter family protein, partial [Aquimarina celericrescens]|nr:GH3 auxin-responsive promoter family protein [Aquimarina celericrescens]
MAIIGNIIKGVINLRNSISPETDHIKNQKETLNFLLEKAKKTEFGNHFEFSKILNSVDPYKNFKSTIPYFDYDKIHN